MTTIGFLQILFFNLILLACVKPLGYYMAHVYSDSQILWRNFGRRIENFIYKIIKINPNLEMNWQTYLMNMLYFNFLGILLLYFIARLQNLLPLNPQHLLSMAHPCRLSLTMMPKA